MRFESGGRLGVYEIVAPAGAGGMGEVYRARDTRLDRNVAIKVLPAELAANAAFRLRFEREAKTISSLSHPNICALYDVGESDSRSYLVMEYLDGETLAERLEKGPLPIDQVLKLGIEIASALDSAHRQGVVHRDLKPGNIMLTKSGAKLLDFGLARSDAAVTAQQLSGIDTMHKPLTDAGTILGTFQYMAPEQVEGQPADARTDIFALGAVLYEAATGKRAFEGKSRASLIAAILDHEPPPISIARPLAPPALDRVIRACLRKDPAERIQTAHDLMLDLTWIRESSSAGEGLAVSAPRRRRSYAMLSLIAALALTSIVLAVLLVRARAPRGEKAVFSVLSAPGAVNGGSVAVSPHGKAVAYYGFSPGREALLSIRAFGDAAPRAIAGTEGAQWPFWSPDSRWVAFFGKGRLQRVNVATGSVQVICDADYGVGGAWSREGTIVFAKRFGDALYRVNAEGGKALPLTRLNVARRESIHGWPQFLDDRRFLFISRTFAEERNRIMVGSLDGGEPKFLANADALVGFDSPYLLYVRDSTLYAQAFDASKLALKGVPVEVVRAIAYAESWGTSGASVSPAGVLAYYPVYMPHVDVQIYDRKGVLLQTLLSDEGIDDAELSPDGKRLIVRKMDPKKGATDLWMIDLARGVRSRVTSGLANHEGPSWSPDGTQIAWNSDRDGMYDIYVKNVDEASAPKVLWKSDRDKLGPKWIQDRSGVVVQYDEPSTQGDIYTVPLDGSAPRAVTADEFNDELPASSPDGRWIAFTSDRNRNQKEIFVISSRGGRLIQVSTDGGNHAAWSPDGSEIFYVAPSRKLMAVGGTSTPTTFDPGIPRLLFELPRTGDRPFSVTSRGTFLVSAQNQTDTTPDHIDVILNWRSALER